MTSITQTIRHSCHRVLRLRSNTPAPKKRALPLRIRLLGVAFNVAALVNREWTALYLSGFWFRVFKSRPRHWVQAFWNAADRSVELHLHDKTIPVYLWGQGPLVVCIHGWGGSGTQFRHMIPRLVEAGYQVASFDGPAHGLNPGNSTNVLEFAQCLIAIDEQVAPVQTVIAHSFGAMATLMAAHHGVRFPRMVFIAPGLDVQEIFNNYCNSLRLDNRLAERFRQIVGERMRDITLIDDPWEFFRPARMLPNASEQGLMIYDQQDEEVSARQFQAIAGSWAWVDTYQAPGLGHYRILKDAAVIQRILLWMQH